LISGYGVKLIPLQKDDLELVRFWRNSDKIRQFAKNKEYITKEMHKKWFETKKGYYFVVEINSEKIGLIWLKEHDGFYESGFYIYEDKYLNNIYSYKIVTLLHKFAFETLKLNEIYCEILPENKRAIRFNLSLGFEKISDIKYVLTKDNFYKFLNKFEKLLEKY
jgi:RimJ/RimL family protein N-acetyltransferase